MARVIGNGSTFGRSGSSVGAGAPGGMLIPNTHTSVAGSAGEVVAFTVGQVLAKPGTSASVQSNAPVSIRYSLSNPQQAANADPNIRSQASWSAAQALTAGKIELVNGNMPFAALEITFTANAVVSFVSW